MPSGNESGANKNWIPGGKTSGGYTEGVMDLKNKDINYKEIDLEKALNE